MLERRIAQLEEKLLLGDGDQAKKEISKDSRLGRLGRCTSRTRRPARRRVHIVGSTEAKPGREQALERVAGRPGALGTAATRATRSRSPRGPARKLKITKIDVGVK